MATHNPDLDTKASAKSLAAALDMTENAFWLLTKRPGFPSPIRLGPKCTRFSRAAVMAWVESQGPGVAKRIRATSAGAPLVETAVPQMTTRNHEFPHS